MPQDLSNLTNSLDSGELLGKVHAASQSLVDVIRDIPWSTHSIVVGVLIGGLVLALFGRWSLRLALALLGLLLGVQAGLAIPAALGADLSSPITAGVGGFLGLLMGLITYRFTIAVAAAALGMAVATTVAAAFVQYAPEELPSSIARQVAPGGPVGDSLDTLSQLSSDGAMQDLARSALPSVDEGLQQAGLQNGAQHVRDFFNRVRDVLGPRWSALNLREKLIVVMASLMGLVGGFAGGLLLHKSVGLLVTAMSGTAMVLPAGAWLATASGAVGEGTLPSDPLVWAGIWLVLSAVAIAIQWRSKKPQADTEE
ncbi:MAG: hypothetical protein KDA20_03685 [Phycisphaerales bacterium]|nr:hypothetical protein [Phycisphaerales bacterium]